MSSSEVAQRKSTTKMPYVRLGNSGLKISRIILGLMTYGTPEWQNWILGEEESLKHIKAAYDAGIQTFDTANVYSGGLSETILGKAIKKYNLPRDEIVVMTKVFFPVGKTPAVSFDDATTDPDNKGYLNQHGLSRKHIFESIKHSLTRLQLDYVDVLQCHRFDPETPISETMHALHDVVKAGYARYIGMSSCYAWQFHAMQNYAIANGLTPFISMQNHYSMLYREEEREMMPTLKHFGVSSIPWSPLARGLLTHPLHEETLRKKSDNFQNQSYGGVLNPVIIDRVEELAAKHNVSMAQISIAWILSKDIVAAPIVGSTKLENLYDIIEGINVKLDEKEIQYLEEAYKPQPITGH